MSDIQQKGPNYHRYRYSIPQLLELAVAAYLPFDLSKFTYDAARAGVVPSLENYAMSSRKSSSSFARTTTRDVPSTADLLVFQGNQISRPVRQPNLPPPAERQKDEGFARFLKKHSSPTHNRVTAGGRIVPMEPRSPPTFSLSSAVTNKSRTVDADQDVHAEKTDGHELRGCMLYNQNHANDTPGSFDQHAFTPMARGGLGAGVPAMQSMYHEPNTAPAQYCSPVRADTTSTAAPMGSPIHSQFQGNQFGGPVMYQPMPSRSYMTNAYTSVPVINLGMSVPATGGYNGAAPWQLYDQSFVQSPTSHVMSAHQLLAAWQKHYVDLDQQLKDIDRHRAMHNLDPQLAEQRRVIVQQRSDAKDTVREYQAMLGFKRQTDSSQDSFATNFNVEAPAYVPAGGKVAADMLTHKRSMDIATTTPVFEKPRNAGGSKAIPIRPPPHDYQEPKASFRARMDTASSHREAEVDEWGVQKRDAPPEVLREQSELSEMLEAERKRKMNSQENVTLYTSGSPETGQSSEGVPCESGVYATEDESKIVDVTTVIPPSHTPPRDIQDEYQQLIKAVSQPKGMVTQVRLLDSRVINVEGQGLELPSSPMPTSDWPQHNSSNPGSYRSRHSRKAKDHAGQVSFQNNFAGKENLSVAPRGHQKAATDAFLAQFNTVDDNVARTQPEARSLRTASNARLRQENQSYQEHYHHNIMKSSMMGSFTNESAQVTLEETHRQGNGPLLDNLSSGIGVNTAPLDVDVLNNKGYSSVSIQNVHAVGRLPNNFDGTIDARQTAQAYLASAEKAKSPRLLRRSGGNGGAWYGPYCREVFERARMHGNNNRPAKQ